MLLKFPTSFSPYGGLEVSIWSWNLCFACLSLLAPCLVHLFKMRKPCFISHELTLQNLLVLPLLFFQYVFLHYTTGPPPHTPCESLTQVLPPGPRLRAGSTEPGTDRGRLCPPTLPLETFATTNLRLESAAFWLDGEEF